MFGGMCYENSDNVYNFFEFCIKCSNYILHTLNFNRYKYNIYIYSETLLQHETITYYVLLT